MNSFDRIEKVKVDWNSTIERVLTLRASERKRVVERWTVRMDDLRAERDELVNAGQWVSGPIHLLDIIGKARWETYHSAIIAWLLNPIAPHGLGSRFVARFLKEIDPEFQWPEDLSGVVPRTEVWKGNSRADIVLLSPEFTVVIEVKVDAVEQPKQCLRLFRDWTTESNAHDVFFVFLTPDGTRGPTTDTEEAASAFASLGFNRVRDLLGDALQSSPGTTGWAGRPVVDAYIGTLTEEFVMTSEHEDRLEAPVEFYLEHRKDIEEWAQLKDRERAAADRFFASVAGPLEERVAESSVPPSIYPSLDEPCRKIFLCREEWKENSGRPRVATGLEWVNSEGFRSYRLGVWVNRDEDPGQRLHNALVEVLKSTDQPGQPRKHWWPVLEEVRPGDRFWEDLPGLRNGILERMQADWKRCAPLIDEALLTYHQPA